MKQHRPLLLSLAVATVIFVVDLFIREDYVTGVFYLAVVGALAYRTGNIRATCVCTAFCTCLWVADYVWGAKRPDVITLQTRHLVEVNRGLVLLAIWGTAALALFARRTQMLLIRHDAELTEREGRLRLAMEAASLGTWDLNATTLTMNCSSEVAKLFGLNEESNITSLEAFQKQVHPDDRELVVRAFQRTLATHGDFNLAFRVHSPGGEPLWVRSTARFLPKDGKQQSLVGVVFDNSRKRKLEEEARRHLVEMSHVNRLTTVGQMVVELTHEISQPLYAIDNFAKACQAVLHSQDVDNRQNAVAWVDQIGTQARRANEIIRRMRRFVQSEAPERVSASVEEIARSVIQLLALDPRLKEIHIATNFASHLPMVLVDPIQIEQVLVNVLINAAEAMHDTPTHLRGIEVSARVFNEEVIVAVKDSGSGLQPDVLERLFEPYFTTKAEGMGMGLAISRSLIEDHGGRLWAEVNADRGLTFQFTLPTKNSSGKKTLPAGNSQ